MVLQAVDDLRYLLGGFPSEGHQPAQEILFPRKQDLCLHHHGEQISISEVTRQEIVAQLREAILRCEAQWRPARGEKPVSTGCQALDSLLPHGGWQWGTIVQWLSSGQGAGAKQIALASLKPLVAKSGVLFVVDPRREFYPLAAQAAGIPLEAIILIYPQTKRDLLWAIGQVLEGGKGAILWTDLPSCSRAVYRRFLLAVEQKGSLGFFFRPLDRGTNSLWADIELVVRPLARKGSEDCWGWQVELVRSRGAFVHKKAVEIFWDEWADCWHNAPPLAFSAAAIRSTAGA
ncbi:MAG: hypothetical protein NZ899_08475 [Thermoguttaceae bacterium]|nr:hypothetical protein [Thermoguttaceae bacterium]MDW8078348.1 hypothetical protein [Thermoguttaceae bacterium]